MRYPYSPIRIVYGIFRPVVTTYDSHPWRLAKSLIAKQNLSHGANVISNGDPLEIYTSKEGEVIFKKYSLMGGVDEFAAQICETLNKTTGLTVAVTDRDSVVAAAGSARRDLIGKRISTELEQIMEDRGIYRAVPSERSVFVTESLDRYCATIAAPIISEGDALGLVVFIGTEGESAAGETEYKLAQAIAGFLGKHMES